MKPHLNWQPKSGFQSHSLRGSNKQNHDFQNSSLSQVLAKTMNLSLKFSNLSFSLWLPNMPQKLAKPWFENHGLYATTHGLI